MRMPFSSDDALHLAIGYRDHLTELIETEIAERQRAASATPAEQDMVRVDTEPPDAPLYPLLAPAPVGEEPSVRHP